MIGTGEIIGWIIAVVLAVAGWIVAIVQQMRKECNIVK